ncbi:hypothetical protein B0H11DRAFT_1803664 [Mycena galericulata]|nr:hypothetical protein B0H11DRAFT_1803664 [Mycena galericulata]
METSISPIPVPYLRILPPELWIACWTLCSVHQLRRLSLVCRVFHTVCLPLLLQHQSMDVGALWYGISGSNWMDRLRKLQRFSMRLDTLTKHGESIRSWEFIGMASTYRLTCQQIVPNIAPFDIAYDRVLAKFCGTLRLCQNLRTLYLQELTIDSPFREALSALSMLQDLTFWNCEIVPSDGVPLEISVFSISLDSPVEIEGTVPLGIVSTDGLRVLHIGPCRDNIGLIRGFGQDKFPSLLDFSLQELLDVEPFLALLKQFPQLETLEIKSTRPDLSPLNNLSSDIIPVLRKITAPWDLITFFIVDRPVSAITVLSEPALTRLGELPDITVADLMLLFNDIARSSVPLISLSIPPTTPSLELMEAIRSMFPALKELSLGFLQPFGLLIDYLMAASDSEDISDAEESVPAIVAVVKQPAQPEVPTSNDIRTHIQRIINGRFLLPKEIEVLRLHWEEDPGHYFSLLDEHQIIASLSPNYPLLREVEIGDTSNIWKRSDTLWKNTRRKSYIQLV